MMQLTKSVVPTRLTRRRVLSGAVGVLGVAAAALLAGCARPGKPELVPSNESARPAVTVRAIDNKFEPAKVQVQAGQAVRWEFAGSAEHDVVADDGSFVSELMREGSYTHVFEQKGEYGYDCSVHPEMTGVVTVVGG
ncbi:cupredoxin domain-containing protein [Leucobacter sp. HY1908]